MLDTSFIHADAEICLMQLAAIRCLRNSMNHLFAHRRAPQTQADEKADIAAVLIIHRSFEKLKRELLAANYLHGRATEVLHFLLDDQADSETSFCDWCTGPMVQSKWYELGRFLYRCPMCDPE